MIYCPTCRNECSPEAPHCPQCGHPLRTEPISELARVLEPGRPTSGLGCPRCGSANIRQRKHESGAGAAALALAFILGLGAFALYATVYVPLVPTRGTESICGLAILCLAAAALSFVVSIFLTEMRGHCRDCRWTWRT
jgi:ssDNA-binding Zn-finger/Zn-ribbon topoisomerase 1